MAAKLKNLHLTKVDFVDEGANQRADIKLAKRNSPEGGSSQGKGSPEPETGKIAGLLKRFANWLIGEGYTLEDVEKAATTFDEQVKEADRDRISAEIYDVMDAFRYSLSSIIYDDEADGAQKAAVMAESLAQFTQAVQGYIPLWSSDKTAGVKKRLGEPAGTGSPGKEIETIKKAKGELEDMLKIDKSKMTPEELAAYESIVKKYAVDVEDVKDVEKACGEKTKTTKEGDPNLEDLDEEEAKKKTDVAAKKSVTGGADPDPADTVAKGTEALIAELKAEVAKMKDEALTRELTSVAKKYEVIGKKAEDLVPTLKSLKVAGGSAYDDMISLLDDMVAAQEASGVFGEIGKSRRSPAAGAMNASESKIEGIAKSLMQADPSMTTAQALAKAWESHPELMEEYEEEAGF